MFDLRDREWNTFTLSDVFDIRSTSSSIDKINLNSSSGKFPYITRTDVNNGINDFVREQKEHVTDAGNCITIGLDTQTAFYQPMAFYTGQNIQVLRSESLNAFNAKFIIPLLKNLMTIFNWGGNGATLTRLKRSKILLPISSANKDKPDWDFMCSYIQERELQLLQDFANYFAKDFNYESEEFLPPSEKKWKEFSLSNIFIIKPGKRLTNSDMTVGKRPFIGASSSNNGITNFVDNKNNSLDKNVLGVNYNGSVVETFFHPYECIFSDDVKRFELANGFGNEYIYLFLKAIIVQQKEKYTYGYKFNEKRMRKQKIMLPIDESGEPDWDYMNRYTRSIKYMKIKTYFDYLLFLGRIPKQYPCNGTLISSTGSIFKN